MFCTFWLTNVLRATAACNFLTFDLQKVARTRQCFYILTGKCASRHSRVPFCRIESSKTCTRKWVFPHFHAQMCLAPQRRSIFADQKWQNRSRTEVFWTVWLENVLLATAPCHFSSVCWTTTSAPAALARLLFEHQEPRIIEKTQRFATSLTFGAYVSSF